MSTVSTTTPIFEFVRDGFEHYCDLTEHIPPPKVAPHASQLSRFLAKWEGFYTVRRRGLAKILFKSNLTFKEEKRRHIGNFLYHKTVHPFSKLACMEQFVMFWIWTLFQIITPLNGSLYYKDYLRIRHPEYPVIHEVRILRYICIFAILCDMIFRFFLGYFIKEKRQIVLSLRELRKHYLKTYFIFDLCPIVATILEISIPSQYQLVRFSIFMLNYVAFARLNSTMELLESYLEKLEFRHQVRTFAVLVWCTVLVLHWLTSILRINAVFHRLVSKGDPDGSWFKFFQLEMKAIFTATGLDPASNPAYFYAAHFAMIVSHFSGTAFHLYETQNSSERLFFAIVIILGLVFYIVTVAHMLEYIRVLNVSEAEFEEMIYQAKYHMLLKKYPKDLRYRVLEYYKCKYDGRYFRERKIIDSLSEHLRLEVVLYSSQHLLQVKTFKGLTKSAIGCLLAFLKSEFYLAGDIITTTGTDDNTIYFIHFGTCEVELLSDVELLHLDDGTFFSDLNDDILGIHNRTFLCRLVAIEPCQIFMLNNKDARYCCQLYPEITEKFQHLMNKKEQTLNEVYARQGSITDSIRGDEILAELRKRKILHHGFLRADFT